MGETMLDAARRALVRELPLPVCKACDDHDLWDRCARAVIASLREPSEAVALDGKMTLDRVVVEYGDAAVVWHAMIDAILEEPKT